jgi:peptidyl-prolyl cis-trans isomerase C
VVVRTRAEAERVRAELRRRPDAFAEVARRASIAPEAAAGGDLGWFARGAGMPEVFDVCFTLPVKALSPVVASAYGFHVFEVTGRRPARRLPLGEVRERVRADLLRQRRAEAQAAYLAALRARARIEIDEAALAGA